MPITNEPTCMRDMFNILTPFIPAHQRNAMVEAMNSPGGSAAFDVTIMRLATIVLGMPSTGETESRGDDAIAHLHYFADGRDWWLTAKDVSDQSNQDNDCEQRRAFGLTRIQEARLGNISIAELNQDATVKLDLRWNPIALREVRARL